jgi:hypothetical protein
MLFPEDPKKRPTLWASLQERLVSDRYCLVVERGVGNPFAEAVLRSHDDVAAVLTRFQAADICRISASRGTAVAPHFALHRPTPELAELRELIVFPAEGSVVASTERLRRDLETLATSVFYDHPDVREVVVPLAVEAWPMPDMKITRMAQGLRIAR